MDAGNSDQGGGPFDDDDRRALLRWTERYLNAWLRRRLTDARPWQRMVAEAVLGEVDTAAGRGASGDMERRRVTLVVGPVGVGKSWLGQRVATMARDWLGGDLPLIAGGATVRSIEEVAARAPFVVVDKVDDRCGRLIERADADLLLLVTDEPRAAGDRVGAVYHLAVITRGRRNVRVLAVHPDKGEIEDITAALWERAEAAGWLDESDDW